MLQSYRSALTLNQEQASRLQSIRGKEQEERKSVDAENTQILVETMTRFDAVTESVIDSMRAQMDAAQEKMDAQRRALMHDISERTRSSIEALEREEDALVQNAEEESDRRAKSLVRQAEQDVARAEAALVDWEHDGAGKNEQIEARLETSQQALSEAQEILTQRNAALAELVGQQTHAEFALKSIQDDLASAERSLLTTRRTKSVSV